MHTKHTLVVTIEADRADGDTFPVSLSSEFPVPRGNFSEVLVHKAGAIDLSRANPLPLIEMHNQENLNIGVVENVRLAGKKLVGRLRLGATQRAQELAADIRSRIVRNISIGYEWLDFTDRGDTVQVNRWRLLEASLVGIPADPTVGINRSHISGGIDMPDPIKETSSQRKRDQDIKDILYLGDKHDMAEMAREYIGEGKSLNEFRAAALAEMETRRAIPNPTTIVRGGYGMDGGIQGLDEHELKDYSICRAITNKIENRQCKELEISDELERKAHRAATGILIPAEYRTMMGRQQMQRQIVGSGDGGSLIGEQHLSGSFIDVLRNFSAAMQAGITSLPGLVQEISIPRQTGATVGQWLDLDHVDDIQEDNLTLDNVKLSLKSIASLEVYSHKMLKQALPAIDMLVMSDLAKSLASGIDKAIINGSGVGSEPIGVENTTGVAGVVVASMAAGTGGLTWAEAVEFESVVGADNALMGNLAFITTSLVQGANKVTVKEAGQAIYVQEGQSMNSYPVLITNHATAKTTIFGNWSDVLLGMWGVLELDVDNTTFFTKASVRVRGIQDVDVAVRHPESFAKSVAA